uniref:Uncharacterized protein n=1 Tax=Oryza sativa subsp. japonica TaxID=39947 RepID=Q6K330_ORYSJ|nr:hypothetical protein [Oryza sativa Japonica Group]BAD23540.1 hypothetical protein [Oryza sativa Japonica Group]
MRAPLVSGTRGEGGGAGWWLKGRGGPPVCEAHRAAAQGGRGSGWWLGTAQADRPWQGGGGGTRPPKTTGGRRGGGGRREGDGARPERRRGSALAGRERKGGGGKGSSPAMRGNRVPAAADGNRVVTEVRATLASATATVSRRGGGFSGGGARPEAVVGSGV